MLGALGSSQWVQSAQFAQPCVVVVDGGINPHINGGARLSRTVNNEALLTVSFGMAGPSQNGSPLSLR